MPTDKQTWGVQCFPLRSPTWSAMDCIHLGTDTYQMASLRRIGSTPSHYRNCTKMHSSAYARLPRLWSAMREDSPYPMILSRCSKVSATYRKKPSILFLSATVRNARDLRHA